MAANCGVAGRRLETRVAGQYGFSTRLQTGKAFTIFAACSCRFLAQDSELDASRPCHVLETARVALSDAKNLRENEQVRWTCLGVS